tara:strand:+ start:1614 stop:2537 length:924 start_codon:yes stop_codon:yes gene_type:complete
MSKKFSASMFDALKGAMADQRSGGNFKDILKTPIGNNFLVRLVPDVNDISKTLYHYFSHGWKSLATGQFVSTICPTTIGSRCPICEERVRLYRGDDEDKENAKLLGRKEQWLVNVYVVDDPTSRENNGTIKMVRYGKQLDKVIRDATEGVDKDEFGARVFDLTDDGCNLRIAVEKNDGGYPTYVSSKFLRESGIDGMTDAKIEKTYDGLFELDKVFDQKSSEEVNEILDTHFFCRVSSASVADQLPREETGGTEVTTSVSTDVVPTEKATDTSEKSVETTVVPESTATGSDADDSVQNKLNDLMKDL